MLLSCPNCATSYEVDRTSLGQTGRSVRCLRCRHIWFASNAAAFADIAAAHRSDIEALAGPMPPDETIQPNVVALPDAPEPGFAEQADTAVTENDSADAPGDEEARARAGESSVVDGELATVAADEAPTLAPTDSDTALHGMTPHADIEAVAARRSLRAAKRRRSRSLQGLTTTILTMVAIITGLIAWRTDVVGWLPQTASLYAAIGMPVNLRGLEFANVKTETDSKDGVPVLVVTGEIVSASKHAVEIPRIRFAMRNDGGKEIYAWTALPPREVLTPGATLPFRSRLASPPREGQQVLVRFFNRRDLASGLQ